MADPNTTFGIREIARALAGRFAKGMPDFLAHVGSGMAAQPVAGLAGLHSLAGGDEEVNRFFPGTVQNPGTLDSAARAVEGTQDLLTYQPHTEAGADAAQKLGEMTAFPHQLAEGAVDKLSDLGVPAALAASIGTGIEIAPNLPEGVKPANIAKALRRGGKKVISTIPWDAMTLEEARAAAKAGEHIQAADRGYVGAPGRVKNAQALGGLRERLDKAVEEGDFGSDWYERARSAISEMSSSPEQADRASNMLALYSPQATPDVNLGHALKQTNDVILRGDKSTLQPYMGYQAARGRELMAGARPDLGEKVGVYEQHINPNKADEAKVRGVNDIWMGKLYGYGNRGFSPVEHSFMTGENLLAAERAKAKGLLPEGVEPNVGNVQAAAWTGARYQKLLKAKGVQQQLRQLQATGDIEGALALEKKLKAQAAQSYDTVLPKYTASETYELVPGRSTEHMGRAADMPFDKRAELSSLLDWSKPGERDPLYDALGMHQRPTTSGLGQFTETVKKPMLQAAVMDPKTGEMQTGISHSVAAMNMGLDDDALFDRLLQGFKKNPEGKFISREQAGYHFRKAGGEATYFRDYGDNPNKLASEDLNGMGGNAGFNPQVDVNVTDYNPNRAARPMVAYGSGARDFDPASGELLRQTNAFRSAMDAQAAGAYGAVAPGAGNTGDAARVTFPKRLSKPETEQLYRAASKADLDLIDTGDGTFKVTKFMGPEGKRIAGPEFLKRLRALEPALGAAKVERGGHIGGYQEVPWGASESGKTTDWLLQNVEPRVGEKLTSTQRVRDALMRKNENELQFKKDNPFDVNGPREDLQRLRALIATHGLEGVREMVKKAGGGVAGAAKLGLPAVALSYLGSGDEAEAR